MWNIYVVLVRDFICICLFILLKDEEEKNFWFGLVVVDLEMYER